MHILFLCHRFPYPPDGGGKIRALHMIRHLVDSGHDVTLCALTRSKTEDAGVQSMRRLCRRVETVRVSAFIQAIRMLACIPTGDPMSCGYFYSRSLAQRIRELLDDEHWDLVVVHCSAMGDYVASELQVPKLIDFCDMDSQKWGDYARHKRFPATAVYALECRRLERHERKLAGSFALSTTISRNELETLRQLEPQAPSDWFPNGVDLDYFRPTGDGYDEKLVCFVGRMDYYPNEQAMLWFCERVWPSLRSRVPDLKLRIVGANPPRSIRRLHASYGVEVTGFVPDVRPHLCAAAVSVAPLRIARGMQNKVLECMAMGLPVVTSPAVASGIELAADSPVVVASSAEEYVDCVLRIVASPDTRSRLSGESREYAERYFSWSSAMAKFDGLIARCIGPTRSAGRCAVS